MGEHTIGTIKYFSQAKVTTSFSLKHNSSEGSDAAGKTIAVASQGITIQSSNNGSIEEEGLFQGGVRAFSRLRYYGKKFRTW